MLEVVQTLNFRYRIKLFGRYERNRLPSESRHPISPATTHSKALRRAQALKALRDLIQFSLSISLTFKIFRCALGFTRKLLAIAFRRIGYRLICVASPGENVGKKLKF